MSEEIERSTSRVRFPGISPRAYEHPVDRGALAVLRAVPGIGPVLKSVAGAFTERGERLGYLATSIRVGPKQYPALDRLRNETAATLDLDPVPELFISRNPQPNAMALGIDKPFIVLTTGLVELLDHDGLRFAIGHEMGHVLSGHALYQTILMRLMQLQHSLGWMPAGYWAVRAVIAALHEWYRKTELSCDRAGLLCAQDPAAALRVHVALAGGMDLTQVDTAEFLKQAKEYEQVEDVRDSVLKLIRTWPLTHPMAVVRAAELQRWAASEEYRAILSGDYRRREDDHASSTFTDDLKEAARSYKSDAAESEDPLMKVVNDLGGVVADAAGKVRGRFSGFGSPSGS
ncbi:M48 family metallopeptidase [Actinosynnema pretiosum subsp. pretiosum]|uniref:Peptidase M48 Ste24p n=2 Tax=Actinosynnema TaxID=40566 RepID=C6WEQ4_ACTMD|nr:M48 family metallopeptidase [Actinosynnema mirum]ACU39679.1 peptidase M48 Ste24p [Actinosynnema mirum DSM 43827]AXX33192.1 Zn-dependent protease with chaperone function [Actinosynnema pretiosum subsp. pretiosum]QUF02976.1 M48 family metallopeptidase [Actinosynnema pretiosum subsp. pretiosum]